MPTSQLKQQRSKDQQQFPVSKARTQLLRWYQVHQRALPWCETKDPWAIWVSEIMLQQTRVTSVLEYFGRFMERFPTVQAMADASWDEVSPMWAGLGYYRRAKHLHAAAQKVCETYQGKIPHDPKEFRSLPGVGAYTAGAVMSIAFNLQEPIVDGNVARVFARLYAWEPFIDERNTQKHLWDWAQQWVIGKEPGDLNQALMELGATVCHVKNPSCTQCPLKASCLAYHKQMVHQVPRKKTRKKILPIENFYAIVSGEENSKPQDTSNHTHLWVIRRATDGLLGGMWGLPLVECQVEAQQVHTWIDQQSDLFLSQQTDLLQKTRQQIQKQRHVELSVYPSAMVEHKFTHKVWRLYLWQAQGKPQINTHTEEIIKLCSIEELVNMALDGPSLKGLRMLGYRLPARRGAGRTSS